MAASVALALPSALASAATITVTTLATAAGGDGLCSLSEAVEAANTDTVVDACDAGNGGDRIRFTTGMNGNLSVPAQLTVSEDLSILGPRARDLVLTAAQTDRIFEVEPSVSLLLDHLVLKNGLADYGGAILVEPMGRLTLLDCLIETNDATTRGGAVHFEAHAQTTASVLHIERTEFYKNEVAAGFHGGALSLSTTTSAVIRDSSFISNRVFPGASGAGGAIYAAGSEIVIERSTLSGNSATAGGGAIQLVDAELGILHSTITDNSAGSYGGGISLDSDSHATMFNTIVADNEASTGFPDIFGFAGASVTSLGYNFVGSNEFGFSSIPSGCPLLDGSCAGTPMSPLDPELDVLSSEGNWTPAHVPLIGSPVLGMGVCPGQPFDQRGFAGPSGRAFGVACDMGSVEGGATDIQPIFFGDFESGTDHRWE